MTDTETSTEEQPEEEATSGTRREQHRVSGDKVIAKIKELLHEGNIRHVVIKNDDGRTLIEFPVSMGVAGAVLLPVWAAVGAVAAIVTKCTLEIERKLEEDDVEDDGDIDISGNIDVDSMVTRANLASWGGGTVHTSGSTPYVNVFTCCR